MRNPSLIQRRKLRRVRWFLLVFVVAETTANLFANAIFSFLPTSLGEYMQYLELMIIEIIAFFSAFMVYSRMESAAEAEEVRDVRTSLRINPISLGTALTVILLGIAGELVMVLLNIPAALIFGQEGGGQITAFDFVIGIAAIVIFPALMEEIMFRGLIFSVFERESARAAILFTTIIFALLHHGFQFILGNLFLGAVLALILYKANSIYAAMLYHFVSNLFALVIDFTGLLSLETTSLFILFALAAAAFAGLMYLFLKIFKDRKITTGKNDLRVTAQNLFSLPVILCILIMAFYSSIVNIFS